jgi:hypothetical protein
MFVAIYAAFIVICAGGMEEGVNTELEQTSALTVKEKVDYEHKIAKMLKRNVHLRMALRTMQEDMHKLRKDCRVGQVGESSLVTVGLTPEFGDGLNKTGSGGSKYLAAQNVVKSKRAEILKYYHGDKELLTKAAARFENQDSEKILVSRMALSILEKKPFVISVAGSSVSAGHDGFGNAAYSAVLERQMGPAWAAAGANLIVRNQAVGGRDPNPYSMCLGPMLGEDTDLVIREWEYWPFSAGFADRDMVARAGADEDEAALEVFLRTALSMRKQPAVAFLKMAHDGHGIGWVNQWFDTKSSRSKLASYSKFAIFGFGAFTAPFAHLLAKAPRSRWNKEHTNHCSGNNVADCPVDFRLQDGYHEYANYSGFDTAAHPDWWEEAQRDGFRRLFVNWHPSPLGHEVIGNQLAYYYLGLTQKALAIVARKEAAKGVHAKEIIKEELLSTAAPLPLPENQLCKV